MSKWLLAAESEHESEQPVGGDAQLVSVQVTGGQLGERQLESRR